MKILIAEDDPDIALTYKIGLDMRNYNVIISSNGEDCLKTYNDELHKMTFNMDCTSCSCSLSNNPPFDIVILDYSMPNINGLDVAKEILSINPHQRIIFISSYTKELLKNRTKSLNSKVELLEKPFSLNELINILEDNKLYSELQKFNIDIEIIKSTAPTHKQILDLLERIRLCES